jgi:fibronectin type 3 domain-containing protein
VYRGEIEPAPVAAQDLSQSKLKSPLELAGSSTTTEFRDMDFQFGKAYRYTVRSVAQFGSDSVESAGSLPAEVTPRDVFPPAVPGGLEIAVVPATPQVPAYVELSWAIGAETDLAGYNVYRNDREDTSGNRLNSELLPSPAFRDISVMPRSRYFYRVSAVDRAGNESPKSSAVTATIP